MFNIDDCEFVYSLAKVDSTFKDDQNSSFYYQKLMSHKAKRGKYKVTIMSEWLLGSTLPDMVLYLL